MDIKEFLVCENAVLNNNHPWEYARCEVIFDILKNYLDKDCPNKVVIDIGCGDVFFLNQFCQRYTNYTPIAVDIAFDDKIMAELSNKYKSLNAIFYKDIEEVKTDNKASVVFLMDIMEHIENDVDFLSKLSQKPFIDNETIFVITVPAFNFLYSSHDKWLGHFRRYSHRLLKNTISKSGMSYISGGYFFFSLLLPRIIQKLFDSFYKNEENKVTGVANWKGSKIFSFLYKNLLLFDYCFFKFFGLLGINVPGLSTYSICKR